MNLNVYLKNPGSILKVIWRYIDFYLFDIILTLSAVIIFLFFPKKLLPFYKIKKKTRSYLNKKNILSHWLVKFPNKKKIKEINILLRGSSLNKNLKRINNTLPTFVVNIILKPKKFKKYYGITASENDRELMIKKKVLPTFFIERQIKKIENKIFWSKLKKNNFISKGTLNFNNLGITNKFMFPLPIGSGLAAIFTLEKIAEKINIYGSDHYLKENINEYSFINLLKELSLLNGQSNLYGPRRRNFFIEAIINLYYINKLIKLKKFNLSGNLKQLHTKKYLIKKLNKVFD